MNKLDLYDIENIEDNKFSINYFIETRGKDRLNETLDILHKYRISKTIENIISIDSLNQNLVMIMFSYLGKFKDYLKEPIKENFPSLGENDLKKSGIKHLLEIAILQDIAFEDFNEEDIFQIEKLKNKVINYLMIINEETINQIKIFKKLLPDFLKENLHKDIVELIDKYNIDKIKSVLDI